MKTSEYIKQLQDILAREGDLELMSETFTQHQIHLGLPSLPVIRHTIRSSYGYDEVVFEGHPLFSESRRIVVV